MHDIDEEQGDRTRSAETREAGDASQRKDDEGRKRESNEEENDDGPKFGIKESGDK